MVERTVSLIGFMALCVLLASPGAVLGQDAGVTFDRILNAENEPENWLTYSGGYDSQRHSTLDQIDADNVADLELKWVYQAESLDVFQTSPLVVDGIMASADSSRRTRRIPVRRRGGSTPFPVRANPGTKLGAEAMLGCTVGRLCG